ncbi:MAG: metallophosphoesterase [Promethearchaeota archaeon]
MIEHLDLNEFIKNPHLFSNLEFKVISKILLNAKKTFENDNILLEFNLKNRDKEIYVIGDIHGNFESLVKIIEIIKENNPELVIFLGDIVDRGPKQLECLLIVLTLKILNPQTYHLLRGNHETIEMNQYYGFFQNFIDKYKDPKKFNEILAVYDVLPICALINNTILCLHGGIPQDTEILKKLKGYKTKNLIKIFNSISNAIFQIMWNDPKSELKGFSNSFRGSGIYLFGEDAFNNFMRTNDLEYLIRAHECFPEGYRWFFNKKLLSIFSSANYRGFYSPNPASYAVIRKNKIIPKIIR